MVEVCNREGITAGNKVVRTLRGSEIGAAGGFNPSDECDEGKLT